MRGGRAVLAPGVVSPAHFEFGPPAGSVGGKQCDEEEQREFHGSESPDAPG